MANKLNWSPGYKGKGNVYPDGSLSTWTTASDTPHHQEVADQEHQRPPAFLFYITPDGGVSDGGVTFMNKTGKPDASVIAQICHADHRLHDATMSSWEDLGMPSNEPRVGDEYGGYGHAQTLMDAFSKTASMGAMHAELKIPKQVRAKIRKWADSLDWPEGAEQEDQRKYHITILTFDEHSDDFIEWMKREIKGRSFEFKSAGLDVFTAGAHPTVVLRFECPEWTQMAIEWGEKAYGRELSPRRFAGGPKPHVSIGFLDPEHTRKPRGIQDPNITFVTGEFNVNINKTSTIVRTPFDPQGAEGTPTGKLCPKGHEILRLSQSRMWCPGCNEFISPSGRGTSEAPSLFHQGASDYEIRPADEGWFSHDTGGWIPRNAGGRDTLQTQHGQGEGRVAYYNGEPVASVTWQKTPQGYMLGSAYTHPDHQGKGLFNTLSQELRDSGEPVDAYVWDNPMLKNKVRDWHRANVASNRANSAVDYHYPRRPYVSTTQRDERHRLEGETRAAQEPYAQAYGTRSRDPQRGSKSQHDRMRRPGHQTASKLANTWQVEVQSTLGVDPLDELKHWLSTRQFGAYGVSASNPDGNLQSDREVDPENGTVAHDSSVESFAKLPQTDDFAKNEAHEPKTVRGVGETSTQRSSRPLPRRRGAEGYLRDTKRDLLDVQQTDPGSLSSRSQDLVSARRIPPSNQHPGPSYSVSQDQEQRGSSTTSRDEVLQHGGRSPSDSTVSHSVGEAPYATKLYDWVEDLQPAQEQPPSVHHQDERDFLPEQPASGSSGHALDPPGHPYKPYDWAAEGLTARWVEAESQGDPVNPEDAFDIPEFMAPDGYDEMKRHWYDRAWAAPGWPTRFPPQPLPWRSDMESTSKAHNPLQHPERMHKRHHHPSPGYLPAPHDDQDDSGADEGDSDGDGGDAASASGGSVA